MSDTAAVKDALRLAASDFESEANALARQPGAAEYVRGIRACVQALRERAECVIPPADENPCAVRCQHAEALGAPEWASCADGVDRCSHYGPIPPGTSAEASGREGER